MKILALSDIYGDVNIISDLYRRYSKENFDVIIVAGGISDVRKNNIHKIMNSLANIGEKLLFVPGGNDPKVIKTKKDNIVNLDNSSHVIETNGLKIGFLGLGGVPSRSIKRKRQYPYRWDERICYNDFMRKLKTDYKKIKLEKPDFIILVTHSPPYQIADYSRKITLSEFETTEQADEEDKEGKTKSTNPLLLGSKILKEFTKENEIDLHIFGHVHKQGGKKTMKNNSIYLNVSHMSVLPYKLTGRKACIIDINKKIKPKFQSIVEEDLDFEEFLHTYI